MIVRAERILLVLPSLERGGAERVLLQLARSFISVGREVHVAVLSGGGPLRAEFSDVAVLHELVDVGHGARGFALARRAFPRLVALMRTFQPQVVLSTMTGTNLLTVLAYRRARIRTRLVLREASSLVNVHRALKRLAMRWLYRRADMVIAVSDGVAEDLCRLGIPNDHIRVISNPVDRERLHRLAVMGHPLSEVAGEPYIIALGRLTEAKGYPTLLQAYVASNLRSGYRLVIVGGGVQRAKLEGMAHELGIADRVLFTGELGNPFRVLAGAALLVLPSHWEGYPNVLLEALALGVPVVSTDCRHGPRELLDNGRHGRLAPVADPVALARAMEDELAQPSTGIDQVVANHDPHVIASRYLSLLDGGPEGFSA